MSGFLLVISLLLVIMVTTMWLVPSGGSHVIMPGFKAHKIREGTLSIKEVDDDDGVRRQHEEDLGDPDKTLIRQSSAPSSSDFKDSVISVDELNTSKGITNNIKDYQIESSKSSTIDVAHFKPGEYAIVQYDSRPLKDYWLASVAWNRQYCKRHGHKYIYYALKDNEKCMAYGGTELLADAWCKVKAMISAQQQHPDVKIFIYMDSDAVIAKKFENMDLKQISGVVQNRLSWDPNVKPMVFNQDGPCWWCNQVKRVGYSTCLNAGTVLWYNHAYSMEVLQEWWKAALDSYEGEGNPFKRKFRIKWPWEQDRQMAVYHRNPKHIQVASQPEAMHIDMKGEWCLSHLAKAQCFIAHHCEDKRSKKKMMNLYSFDETPKAVYTTSINYLEQEPVI